MVNAVAVYQVQLNCSHFYSDDDMMSCHWQDLYDQLDKELEIFSVSGNSGMGLSDDISSASDTKMNRDSSTSLESNETTNESTGKHAVEKGSKKKKGKASGSTKTSIIEDNSDYQDYVPTKSKKNQKKNKDTFSPNISEVKSGARKYLRSQEESTNVPSEEWVVQKIMTLFPDWEEQGPNVLAVPIFTQNMS